MNIFQSIILSIVEGVTEFLPISSTGHLVLASKLINVPQTEFVKTFEIFIQLGAIAAIVFLRWRHFLTDKKIIINLAAAFLPTSVIGLFLYKFIKQDLIGNIGVTLVALFVGGIALLMVDKFFSKKKKIEKLTWKKALVIGLFQSLSVIPGVSRAAATIVGGLSVGMKKEEAVEFSFLLAVPTMLAASGLDLVKSNLKFSSYDFLLLGVGFLGAFLTAAITVKLFVKFVSTHSFKVFGIYRIILALVYGLVVRG